MKPRVPTWRANMRRFLKWLFQYLHFVVGEALKENKPRLLGVTVPASAAVVREFPVRCPDTTWKPFRIASLAVAASFLRETDERLCHLELGRGDFFTWLSWSSAFKPSLCAACFPPSHRLRFVFMLGNQKQPVLLAAASWLIKHEAAMTTTKSGPPPPHARSRAQAHRPFFFFFKLAQRKHDLILHFLSIASTLQTHA